MHVHSAAEAQFADELHKASKLPRNTDAQILKFKDVVAELSLQAEALSTECADVTAENISPKERQEIAGICANDVSYNAYGQKLLFSLSNPAESEVISA